MTVCRMSYQVQCSSQRTSGHGGRRCSRYRVRWCWMVARSGSTRRRSPVNMAFQQLSRRKPRPAASRMGRRSALMARQEKSSSGQRRGRHRREQRLMSAFGGKGSQVQPWREMPDQAVARGPKNAPPRKRNVFVGAPVTTRCTMESPNELWADVANCHRGVGLLGSLLGTKKTTSRLRRRRGIRSPSRLCNISHNYGEILY